MIVDAKWDAEATGFAVVRELALMLAEMELRLPWMPSGINPREAG
jgi:hypothetical protein